MVLRYFEKDILLSVLYILIGLLAIGTIGFKYAADIEWMDAFHVSTLYVTGAGSPMEFDTTPAQIWSSIFALIAGSVFIGIGASLVADIVKQHLGLD